jgi:hypothetical protein
VQRIVEELHRVLHEGDGVPTLATRLPHQNWSEHDEPLRPTIRQSCITLL